MRCCDRAGNGQPDAIAAGFGIARTVGAVEPVEQVLQLLLTDRLDGVEHRKVPCPALLFQHHADLAARIRILDRVVQQDGDQLADHFLVPVQREHGLDMADEFPVVLYRKRLKGADLLLHHVGQGEVQHLLRAPRR